MAKKKNNEHDIPESVCMFTKEEMAYIALTAKHIPYSVDISKAEILVPPERANEAYDNLWIQHLENKFGFVVQVTIGAEVRELNEFDPVLKMKNSPVPEMASLSQFSGQNNLIKVGAEFIDTRDYDKVKRIFSDKGKKWEMCHVGDMRPNYQIDKETLEISIKHNLLKFR